MYSLTAIEKSINKKIKKIEDSKQLKITTAYQLVNQIAEAATQAIILAQSEHEYEIVERLARQVERAYLLASERVTTSERDKMAFASSYWSLRADYAKMDAAKIRSQPPTFQQIPAPAESSAKIKARLELINKLKPPEEMFSDVSRKPFSEESERIRKAISGSKPIIRLNTQNDTLSAQLKLPARPIPIVPRQTSIRIDTLLRQVKPPNLNSNLSKKR